MDERAYTVIERAVYRRWRRRQVYGINLALFSMVVLLVLSGFRLPFDPYSNFLALTLVTWLSILVIHTVYAVFAELRDRALRHEIEREYRRRLADNVDSYDAYLRARAARLAEQGYDGEMLDLEQVIADQKAKRKRM